MKGNSKTIPLINPNTSSSPNYIPPNNIPVNEDEATKQELKSDLKAAFDKENYDLDEAAHPIACIFTVIFKALGFFIYFFMGVFLDEILIFVLVSLCSVFDFWTVKNISGRLLVGMRWWTTIENDGSTGFTFESWDRDYQSNRVDSFFFWTSQICSTIGWLVFFVLHLLSLSLFWSILNGLTFFLAALNLYGYYKCRGDQTNKAGRVHDYLKKQGIKSAGKYLLNKI